MSYLEVLLLVVSLFRAGRHTVFQPQSMCLLRGFSDVVAVFGSMNTDNPVHMNCLICSYPDLAAMLRRKLNSRTLARNKRSARCALTGVYAARIVRVAKDVMETNYNKHSRITGHFVDFCKRCRRWLNVQ